MIRRFGTLFQGHVDLENEGFAGTPVHERFYSNEHLATVFDKAVAVAKVLDENNFDTLWLAEHHFQPEGYECIPNILALAIHLHHLTKRIKFGCGFNIAPMWHPLRLAEDYATADILTGGRVVFGVGRGYHTREVEVFGAPMLDADANRALFEEQVEVILKAFNEESFSHHGKHYTIPPAVPYRGYTLDKITLVPRPLKLPVEIYQPIVSASERALDFMTKHGLKGMIGGGAAPGGASERVVQAWQAALRRAGRETVLGADLIVGVLFHIADTEAQAIKEAKVFFEENIKMFAPLGFIPGLTPEQIAATADPLKAPFAGLPTLEAAVKAGAWLCGPPELIRERLLSLQERLPGLEEITIGHVVGTPQAVMLEQLEWLGRDVIPAFKNQSGATN